MKQVQVLAILFLAISLAKAEGLLRQQKDAFLQCALTHQFTTRGVAFVLKTDPRNFFFANENCMKHGGNLAETHTLQEEKLLKCVVTNSSAKKPVWIGLRRNTTSKGKDPNSFHWLRSGYPLTDHQLENNTPNASWYTDEPNNNRYEECVVLSKSFGWKWNDSPCSINALYACELPVSAVTIASSVSTASTESTVSTASTASAASTAIPTKPSNSGATQFTEITSAITTLDATPETSSVTQNTSIASTRPAETISSEPTPTDAHIPIINVTRGVLATTSNPLPLNSIKMSLKGKQGTIRLNVTKQLPIQYAPGELVERFYPNSALLGLQSEFSFEVVPKTIHIPMPQLTFSLYSPASSLLVTKRVLLKSLLDVSPPKNLSVGVTYTILVNSKTVNATDLTSSKCYGKEGVVTFLSANVECRFYDPTTMMLSSAGLQTVTQPGGQYRCISNHTTIFAALLTVNVVVIPNGAKILTYITESISVASLFLTLVILIRLRKKLRNDRTLVQINLVIALLLLHVASILHDTALPFDRFCEFIALTLHVSMLSAAFWMLIEGVTLIIKTSDRALAAVSSRKVRGIQLAVGWLLPFVLVLCTAVPGFITNTYMATNPKTVQNVTSFNKYQKCWLSSDSGMLVGAVIVPVGITIAVNFCILTRLGMLVNEKSKKAEKFKPVTSTEKPKGWGIILKWGEFSHLRASARAVLMLLPVLCVPWCLFIIADTGEALIYITVIFNGLQGFFVFLVYCAFNKDVKRCLARIWRRSEVARRYSFFRKKRKNPGQTPSNGSALEMDKVTAKIPTSMQI